MAEECAYAACRRTAVVLVDGWRFCASHELEHRAEVAERERSRPVPDLTPALERWAERRAAALWSLRRALVG